jgi:hypothetical protein
MKRSVYFTQSSKPLGLSTIHRVETLAALFGTTNTRSGLVEAWEAYLNG